MTSGYSGRDAPEPAAHRPVTSRNRWIGTRYARVLGENEPNALIRGIRRTTCRRTPTPAPPATTGSRSSSRSPTNRSANARGARANCASSSTPSASCSGGQGSTAPTPATRVIRASAPPTRRHPRQARTPPRQARAPQAPPPPPPGRTGRTRRRDRARHRDRRGRAGHRRRLPRPRPPKGPAPTRRRARVGAESSPAGRNVAASTGQITPRRIHRSSRVRSPHERLPRRDRCHRRLRFLLLDQQRPSSPPDHPLRCAERPTCHRGGRRPPGGVPSPARYRPPVPAAPG